MDNFPPMASERRPKWRYKSMGELHQVTNAILRYIMVNERCKRWAKVAEAYRRLLWLIDRKHFPSDYEAPDSYAILIYELHFHLGLALQRMGAHRKSIHHYTEAIKVVSIPKGGCLAGCMTNSCMMTPLYSRRAFAYTQIGDLTGAIKDAENGVVLDNLNPDVYCIRALVRSSRNEEKQALHDLDHGLRLSPNHVACLVVRGAITRPLLGPAYDMAEKLNPDSQSYFNVDSFNHPFILDFYDRLLGTLMVPHTITDINLNPDKPSKKQIESSVDQMRSESSLSRPGSSRPGSSTDRSAEPFRCGTPAPSDNVLAARRRRDYGEAVRKHNQRPKTAADYMAILEKSRRMKATVPPRPATAHHAPSQPVCDVIIASPAPTQHPRDVIVASPAPNLTDKTASGRKSKTTSTATTTFTFNIPTNYSIPVFQQVNVAEAPRMYYRPWRGDKLPIADVPHPLPSPAFY